MHEMSIAQNILEIIQEHLTRNNLNGAHVKVVRMRVGEMGGVVLESLRFCFQAASEGTAAANAELSIEAIPVCCRCRRCDKNFLVEQFTFICPTCNGTDAELISGNELEVVALEIEEEDC